MNRAAQSICTLRYFLLFLILSGVNMLWSQESYPAFIAPWRLLPDDTSKVRQLHRYLDDNYVLPADSFYLIATEGLELANQLKDSEGIVLMRMYQGFGKMDQGLLEESVSYFDQAIEVSTEMKDTFLMARGMMNRGLVEQDLGHEGEALTYYQQAAFFFDKVNKPSPSLFNNIAIIYRKQGNHQSAIQWYKRSLELKQAQGDTLGAATTYMNLALVYGKEDDSLATFHAAEQALNLLNHEAYPSISAWAKLAIGNLSADFGRSADAQTYYRQALTYYRLHPENEYYYHVIYGLGKEASRQENWQEARAYFSQALELAREGHKREDLQTMLKNLAEALFNLDQADKAYPLLAEAYRLKDTLTQLTRLSLEKEMLTRFEVDRRESQLQINRLELKSRKLNQRVAWGLVAMSMLGIVGVLYFLFQKNRATQLLRKQNQLIEKSLKEKEALMREMHHRVKNNLQYISSLLRLQKRETHSLEAKNLLMTSQNLVMSMALIHQHLYQGNDLSGIHIDRYLDRLITEIIQAFKPQKLDLTVRVEVEPLILDIEQAIPLGLIVNELITNALKYAYLERETGQLSILLSHQYPDILLCVQDDGPGVASTYTLEQKHQFGYQLIHLLTEQLSGELQFDLLTGFSVSLHFPSKAVLI
ncbi:MAG: tetratricopeptide repeat protein [Bacteroidota bacterium]